MSDKESSLPLNINELKPMRTRIIESAVWCIGMVILLVIYDLISSINVTGTIAWFFVVFGIPLLKFFFFSRYRFELNEEGVRFKPFFGRHYSYQWDSFRSFSADSSKHRFVIQREGVIKAIQLESVTKYDEIKQILTERITPTS